MSLVDTERPRSNPLDLVEQLAAANEWSYERGEDNEITVVVVGKFADYSVNYTWMPDIETLHLSCSFDLRVPELPKREEVQRLISQINEMMWVGHFDMWVDDGIILFRQALVLAGGVTATDTQCEALLGHALGACERYYSAFMYVVWAGKKAEEAYKAAGFDTIGNA